VRAVVGWSYVGVLCTTEGCWAGSGAGFVPDTYSPARAAFTCSAAVRSVPWGWSV